VQGRLAGVQIEQGSGKLGQGIQIRVRGTTSILGGNQPLVIIDGLPINTGNLETTVGEPTNPLADINFNDIETFEVLKDAAATAIYGARGANGVIQITTKRGKIGRTTASINYFQGWSDPTKLRKFLNNTEYVTLFNEAWLNSGFGTGQAITNVGGGADFYETDLSVNTDWQRAIYRVANVTQIDFNVQGGNEKTQFYISTVYNNQESIIRSNRFERINARIAVDHNIAPGIKIGANISIYRNTLDRVSQDNAFSTPGQAVALAPITPFTDRSTGRPVITDPLTGYYNPVYQLQNAFIKTLTSRTISTGYVSFELIQGFTYRGDFGLDMTDQREDIWYGRNTQDGRPGGFAYAANTRVLNYNTNQTVTWQQVFDEKHKIDVVIGAQFQLNDLDYTNAGGTGLPNEQLFRVDNVSRITLAGSGGSGFRFGSVFARANYKLLDRYLISLSTRYDASSRFGSDNQVGFFPAASVGWILSNEEFMKGNGIVSFFKPRASIGVTGNAEINNFAARTLVSSGRYANEPTLGYSTLDTRNLKWETTTQYDYGFDLNFLNDRITSSLSIYNKSTKDLLLNTQLPGISGYTSVLQNAGTMVNYGAEISLGFKALTGDVKWDVDFNIAQNTNRVTSTRVAGQANPSIISVSAFQRAQEGHPIGSFYMAQFNGVNPANGNALWLRSDGSSTESYAQAERRIVGNPNPLYVGGFTNSLSYKGIDLRITFQFVSGNKIYNNAGQYMSTSAPQLDNQTVDQLNRWQKPGDITNVPRATLFAFGDGNQVNNAPSTRYLEDGSYLRLKVLSLGYTIPTVYTNVVFLRSARIYMNATNLLTITPYQGADPEVSTNATANIGQGVDFYTIPQARTITFGLTLGF
jgi:TonB-dependent starch-binding outer membrane protein SusC